MAFFPFSRKPKNKSPKSTPKGKARDEKSELTLKLEAVKQQRQEILEKAEAARRKVEDIPKLLEERKRREQAMIKDRARKSKTLRGLDRATYRLPVATASQRMTRGQERAQFTRFLILCAALLGILMLLWRAAK